jgi:catechol 2,3-dioxygenase-like lactoylglutathione lyase family enzyme
VLSFGLRFLLRNKQATGCGFGPGTVFSYEFYQKLLNFTQTGNYILVSPTAGWLLGMPEAENELSVQVAVLTLGDETLELLEFQSAGAAHEMPTDSASNDLWFQHLAIVVSNMDTAWEHLEMFDVDAISPAPQTFPGYLEAAGISAFYFKDPDGHVLELIHFPTEKGDSKWHKKQSGLFLGIDHTAIAVQDTFESLPFYQQLGFTKNTQTKNYGPQQEMLNQVKDAQLLVTSSVAEAGMGVEFLDF